MSKSLMFLGIVVIIPIILAGVYWFITNLQFKGAVKSNDETVAESEDKKV